MLSWRNVLLWLFVLVFTTALTWQIVSAADSSVSDPPLAAVAVSTTTVMDSSTTSTSVDPTSTTTAAPASSTTSAPAGTTSTSERSPGTTSTTAGPTTTAEQWNVKTIDSAGGSVVVRYRTGEVELVTATPASGFVTEVDEAGPPRVRVEFKAEDSESEIRVEWEDGQLDVEIDES